MAGMHEILRDGGDQTLTHVPPTRVATATYVIEDLTLDTDNAARILASGSATVDSLSETTIAASGVGQTNPRRIAITNSTAVAGRTYEIVSDDGTTERLRCDAVTTSAVLTSGRMSGLYPVGSSLQGIELRATFPTASAANDDLADDERPLRVVWTYTYAGRTVRVPELVRIVRQSADPTPYLAAAETRLRETWPELVAQLPARGNSLALLVRGEGTALAAKLRVQGLDPAGFLMGDPGMECLVLSCVWKFGKMGFSPRGWDSCDQWAEESKRDFLNMWNATTANGGPGLDAAGVDRVTDTAATGHRPRHSMKFIPS